MNKVFTIIVCVCLLGYIIYLQHVNTIYQRQISESQTLINKLIVKDSLTSSLIDIQETDSMFVIKKVIDKNTGHSLTYHELDSICEDYFNLAQIREQIILSAKRHYKFNYSYKIKGDSIIISFWNKY